MDAGKKRSHSRARGVREFWPVPAAMGNMLAVHLLLRAPKFNKSSNSNATLRPRFACSVWWMRHLEIKKTQFGKLNGPPNFFRWQKTRSMEQECLNTWR